MVSRGNPVLSFVVATVLVVAIAACSSEPTITDIGAWTLIKKPVTGSNETIYSMKTSSTSSTLGSAVLQVGCEANRGGPGLLWLSSPRITWDNDHVPIKPDWNGEGGYRIGDAAGEFILTLSWGSGSTSVVTSVSNDRLNFSRHAVEMGIWRDMLSREDEVLTLSAHRYDGASHTADFRIEGLTEALERTPCHWQGSRPGNWPGLKLTEIGAWTLTEEPRFLRDRPEESLMVSYKLETSAIATTSGDAALMMRCGRSGKLVAPSVRWNGRGIPIGGDFSGTGEYQIGNTTGGLLLAFWTDASRTDVLTGVTDVESDSYRSAYAVDVGIWEDMLSHEDEVLTFLAHTHDGTGHAAQFRLHGLAEVLERLPCGDSGPPPSG